MLVILVFISMLLLITYDGLLNIRSVLRRIMAGIGVTIMVRRMMAVGIVVMIILLATFVSCLQTILLSF